MVESALKHSFVAICAVVGVANYVLWYRARKESGWEWVMFYYVGGVSLLFTAVFGVMIYWQYYA